MFKVEYAQHDTISSLGRRTKRLKTLYKTASFSQFSHVILGKKIHGIRYNAAASHQKKDISIFDMIKGFSSYKKFGKAHGKLITHINQLLEIKNF